MSPPPSSVDFSPSIRSQTPFAAVAVTLFAATLAIAPVAQAQLPAGPPIYGCFAPNTGSVYATSYGGATMPTAPANCISTTHYRFQWGGAGPQGPKGDPGATGATGPQGAVGPKGDPGATGATGPQGTVGPKGDVGATGATGPQGARGPKGEVGATGATGPQGAVGPKGDVGATGAAGA